MANHATDRVPPAWGRDGGGGWLGGRVVLARVPPPSPFSARGKGRPQRSAVPLDPIYRGWRPIPLPRPGQARSCCSSPSRSGLPPLTAARGPEQRMRSPMTAKASAPSPPGSRGVTFFATSPRASGRAGSTAARSCRLSPVLARARPPGAGADTPREAGVLRVGSVGEDTRSSSVPPSFRFMLTPVCLSGQMAFRLVSLGTVGCGILPFPSFTPISRCQVIWNGISCVSSVTLMAALPA